MDILDSQLKNNKLSNAYIFESINKEYNLKKAIDFSKKVFDFYGLDLNVDESPDLKIINEDFELKNIPISLIRDMIKDMYLRPSNGKIKIYIINDSSNLTQESSNALLKSIEEPKDYVIYIFTTNNAFNLLKTIRSRCQLVSIESKKDKTNIDYNKLSDILAKVIGGKLSYFYKNKEFFASLKENKEDLFDLILVFFNDLLRYKYFHKDKVEDENSKYYFRKIENLDFDSIDKIIKKTEMIQKGFKNNVNFDMSVENFIFFIFREGMHIESNRT